MRDELIEDIVRMLESLIIWELDGTVIVFTSEEELEKYLGDIEI